MQSDDDIKLTATYIHSLALDKKLDTVLQRLDDQSKEISAIRVLINASWALTPAQKVR